MVGLEVPAGKKQQSELKSVQSSGRLGAAGAGLFGIAAAGTVVAGFVESLCTVAAAVGLGSLVVGFDPDILCTEVVMNRRQSLWVAAGIRLAAVGGLEKWIDHTAGVLGGCYSQRRGMSWM